MPIYDEDVASKHFRSFLDSFSPLNMVIQASDAKLNNLKNAIEGELARQKSSKSDSHSLAIPNARIASSRGCRGQFTIRGCISKKSARYCAGLAVFLDTPQKIAGVGSIVSKQDFRLRVAAEVADLLAELKDASAFVGDTTAACRSRLTNVAINSLCSYSVTAAQVCKKITNLS